MSGPEQFNSKQDDKASTAPGKTGSSELHAKLMTEVQDAFKNGTSSDDVLHKLGKAMATYSAGAIFGSIFGERQVGADQQSEEKLKSTEGKVNIPVSFTISSDRLKDLSSSKMDKPIQWDPVTKLKAYYDESTKTYCFDMGTMYLDKEGRLSPELKLHLSADGQNITKIEDLSPEHLESNLARLVVAGVLKRDFLNQTGVLRKDLDDFGLKEAVIQNWLKRETEDRRVIGSLMTGDLATLKKPEKFNGKPDNTEKVLQGQAKIVDMTKNPDVQGFYTHGAGPCLILILTRRGQDGKPEKIAVAHIPSAAQPRDIRNLISRTGANSEKIEADVISGSWDRALMVGWALENSGVKVRFANVDPEGTRVDNVAVDRQGNIYYGLIPELTRMSPSDIEKVKELMWRSAYAKNSVVGGLEIIEK